MLILNRRLDEKVRFPDLGVTVQILRVKGSSVRLGIDAPVEVRIIRDELEDEFKDRVPAKSYVIRLPRTMRHELRNELNALSLALHLFKQEMESGNHADAKSTFAKLTEYLERLDANQLLSSSGASIVAPTEQTALLVEDQPNEREMLAGFLRLHGYQVATAADGVEAIEYLETNEKPAVVLIDMRMPRCDGPTTIRRIRENPAFDLVKIFAISGSTAEESNLNLKAEGVNGWFMKPLNPKSLVEALSDSPDLEPSAA